MGDVCKLSWKQLKEIFSYTYGWVQLLDRKSTELNNHLMCESHKRPSRWSSLWEEKSHLKRRQLGGSSSTYDHRLTSSCIRSDESSGRFEEYYHAQTQRSLAFALKAKNRKFFYTFSLCSHSSELQMNFFFFCYLRLLSISACCLSLSILKSTS